MAVDLLDILTPDEALRALSLSDNSTTFTDELEQTVTGVSRHIDKAAGPVVYRTVTERLSVGYGSSSVCLRYYPVYSVTSITEYTPGSASGQLLTAEDEDTFAGYGYLLDPDTGMILRRSNGGTALWTAGDRNVVAVYVAGRYATTATVDRRFKAAAAAVLRAEWAVASPSYRKSSNLDEDFAVAYSNSDDMIRGLLADELVGPRIGAG